MQVALPSLGQQVLPVERRRSTAGSTPAAPSPNSKESQCLDHVSLRSPAPVGPVAGQGSRYTLAVADTAAKSAATPASSPRSASRATAPVASRATTTRTITLGVARPHECWRTRGQGSVAQLVERSPETREVTGSNPVVPTTPRFGALVTLRRGSRTGGYCLVTGSQACPRIHGSHRK